MQISIAAEKQKGQASGSGSNSLYSSHSTSANRNDTKKPNVRTTDYRQMIQIFLTDPDSVTREEFMFFQRVLGYRQALTLLDEGKRRKRSEKTGQPIEPLQSSSIKNEEPAQLNETAGQESENGESDAGLPIKLRAGIEKLSGVDLSDVNVHKNSGKPEQAGALAYTQGKDIYLAPGQESQLPHESWHAVQQKQGRVMPTLQTQTGSRVNDNEELESEADKMGGKADSSYTMDGSKGGSEDNVSDTILDSLSGSTELTAKEPSEEIQGSGTAQFKRDSSLYNGTPDEVIQKKDKNSSNILDIIQSALDIIGFIPGLGDIADAVNTGIAIIRKQWLNAVFSAIAMIPAIGSAIAAPIKILVKAAGDTKLIKKAINLLAPLLGGLNKVVPKLSELLNGLKGTIRKLPKLIGSIGDNLFVKFAIGEKGIKAIRSFSDSMKNGIETVCKWVDNVIVTIKKAVGKGTGNLSFKTGKAGEEYLANLVGGKSQVYFKTSQGGRYIDQLAGDIAYESKVGYTTLTDFVKKQILKDAELIKQGSIKGANWNFFMSDVTGKVGASKPLLDFLKQHGITYTIH